MDFKNRVEEQTIARILESIASVPNRRDRPRIDDLEGPFDFWFDGGACTIMTGSVEYVFEEGTVATVGAPLPVLSVTIRFTDGKRVLIQQENAGT